MSQVYSEPEVRPPLDENLYSLDPDELAFFKTQTGIEDDNLLKAHIIVVQAKAYEIYSYPCIRLFLFTKLNISRLPAYGHVLRLGRERERALLLDIGCCFGNDARKAVVDGYPIQNVIASDLRQGFWDLGHELFKSSPESFPVRFIAGDIFDPDHLAPRSPFNEPPLTPLPDLNSLTRLTPLHGHISVIHASALFHLFCEAKQWELAQALASLLSPLPGSVIFGAHAGRPTKGVIQYDSEFRMFCHSPHSWCELWDGQIFGKGTVQVMASLREVKGSVYAFKIYILSWSVTRL